MIKLSETRKERVYIRKKKKKERKQEKQFTDLQPSPRGVKPERKDLQRRKKFILKKSYQYATLSVPVPKKFWKSLKDVQGVIDPKYLTTDGFEDDFHVTIYYGLTDDDASKVGPIMSKYVLNPQAAPNTIVAKTTGYGTFKDNEDFDVLTLRIQSDELSAIHYLIEKELDPPGNNYLVYRPHITIAYLKKSVLDIDLPKLPEFSWATSIMEFIRSNGILNREILISNNEYIINRVINDSFI